VIKASNQDVDSSHHTLITAPKMLFTDLPPELRTRIYEAYFDEQRQIRLPSLYDSPNPWNDQQPPITHVSRQIRAESLPTFYGYCTYDVHDVCGFCRPKHGVQRAFGPESALCRCIVHKCDRESRCRYVTRMVQAWSWIYAIGDHNLADIKTITLGQYGSNVHGHVGYVITIHQHPQTKVLSVSDDSHWQEDVRRWPRKIMASEPEGQAIRDELMALLDQNDPAKRGLTADNIERILRHADDRSFQLQRTGEDLMAWMEQDR